MRHSTLTVEVPGTAAAFPATGVTVNGSSANTQELRATIGSKSVAGTNDVRLWACLILVVAVVALGIGMRWQKQAVDDSCTAQEAALAAERLRNADAMWNLLMEQQTVQKELERVKKDGSYFDERIEMYQSMHDRLLQEHQRMTANGAESHRMLETLGAYRQRINALETEKTRWQH